MSGWDWVHISRDLRWSPQGEFSREPPLAGGGLPSEGRDGDKGEEEDDDDSESDDDDEGDG